MSEESKLKLMRAKGISSRIAVMLESAGLLTPRDIKLADNDDLEAAGLTQGEIEALRSVCPAYQG